jgi:hypothetical protein
MPFFRHAGPEEPAPYLIRVHPDVVLTKVGNPMSNTGSRFSPGTLDSPPWREMTTFLKMVGS